MENNRERVYLKFSRTKTDGSVVKLRIQDMPKECAQDVSDLNVKYFLSEEPVHRSTGLYKSEEALAEYHEVFSALSQAFNPRVVICCIDDDPNKVGQIVGASSMYVAYGKIDLSQFQVHTKEMKKLFEMAIQEFYCYDVVKKHNVEKFYDDISIVVVPEFRRLGIAKEFVKLRRAICKEENVPLASAWMSAWGTQKAGEDDGWETVLEINLGRISEVYGVTFENAPPSSKLMIGRPT